MDTLVLQLKKTFKSALLKAFPEDNWDDNPPKIEVTQSTQDKFGHYQFNSAMSLAKQLKNPPRAIAEKIVAQVDTQAENKQSYIESLEIAGPGFVNITLNQDYLSQSTQEILNDAHLGIPLPTKKQRIVIDFSSPNVAKEMHVGHLRSTIIGDCLARVFEFQGHDVLRLNHIGNWGTQFGMLIAYIKDEHPHIFDGTEDADLPTLMAWYKASKKRFDADEAFKKTSQDEVVALQGGNESSKKAWEKICEISSLGYQEIYDLLDVKIIERGESFYNPMLNDIVKDLENKSLIKVSDGAKCVFVDGFTNREGDPLPLMVQKSNGGFNYATTDLAAIKHRVQDEKGNRLIYVTDMGQQQHFKMFFAVAKMAGYYNTDKVRVDHVPFGLVLGADGKKFKTRSGDTEKLIDLLTTAIERAGEIMKERMPDMSNEERNEIAKALGIGAVKYADLSCQRTGDYVFSYDRMLRFEGNTAAFLMYAYVRIAGIKRKVNVEIDDVAKDTMISLKHPSEISLGLHLCRFGEMLESLSSELCPNRLTEYLYECAQRFNAFFRDCRVEGTAEQNERLLLCEAVARVMKQGLEILGLKPVSRM
ncbi:Arginine--tRNA ligase [Chlamydiales bacterium SCGC AG-110-M15]|nr:Arginine--tRNA ligase [Chlamydiales bacterium SCGC AG-110-M15]